MIDDKYHYKDKFILKNTISDVKWNQSLDTIKETDPPIIVHVDNGTGMNNNHFSLLGDNNITEDLQKDDRLSEWFTAEETSFLND